LIVNLKQCPGFVEENGTGIKEIHHRQGLIYVSSLTLPSEVVCSKSFSTTFLQSYLDH
jgi:hypothetical protein